MSENLQNGSLRANMIAANLEPSWSGTPQHSAGRTNILQIVLDDTGWSDFGCFGSPIATPNIDALANQGLRYSNFHVTPLCSPTRACLLTGRNHHSVGMRFLTALDTGFDNSRGRVDPAIEMIPSMLAKRGYGTYLVGKWHLVPKHQITPAGPFDHWPLGRGFSRFCGFLDGCTDQYLPELFQDNTPYQATLSDGEHLNDHLADRAISMLTDHLSYRANDPFYMTFAVGATHAPLQAPRELIDKYVPLFEQGWDVERAERLVQQIKLGVVPQGTQLTERNPGVKPWKELSADERRLFVRQQAAYAAFLEHTDQAIGRIVQALEKLELLDDTLILVFADNGASREGAEAGAVDTHSNYSGKPESVADQLERIDAIGGPEGPAHYPEGWAMASNTPFRRYKQLVDLGGVRAPLIAHWPNGITDQGAIRTDFAHVIDLAATVADLAGVPTDEMDGAPLHESFRSGSHATRSHQYWEMFGHRAIWQGGWKAVTEHQTGADYDTDTWRLYDTATDFSESQNVAADHPEKLAQLQALWMEEAHKHSVFPLDDRPLKQLLNETTSPDHLTMQGQVRFYPQNTHIPVATGVTSAFRPVSLRAQVRGRAGGQSGLLVASGGGHCGYALYLDGDKLVFEHAALGKTYRIAANVKDGDREIGFDVVATGQDRRILLIEDGKIQADKPLPNAMRNLSFWGLDVGIARVPLITDHTSAASALPAGVLHSVTFDFKDTDEALKAAEDHARTD